MRMMNLIRLRHGIKLIFRSQQQQSKKLFATNTNRYDGGKLFSKELSDVFPKNKLDRYGGLYFDTTINTGKSKLSPEKFLEILMKNLDDLNNINISNDERKTLIKTIWFKISPEQVYLIQPLVKLDFKFHHTKGNELFMFKTLSSRDNIPEYAYTNIGVGGFVVNDQDEILVVKENVKITKYWKFPGGYAEQGEDLCDAVVREVREETGIETEFRSILTMRHMHKSSFNCSDMYFVCYLHAKSKELHKCPHEIDQCQWIPIDQIKDSLSVFNNFVVEQYLNYKKYGLGIHFEKMNSTFPPPYDMYSVYSIKKNN